MHLKGIIAGTLAAAAGYAFFKALPEKKQEELKNKARDTFDKAKDLGYDVAYAGADLVGDFSDKAQQKVIDLDKQISDSKYGDKYSDIKDKAGDLAKQTKPYVKKAKDTTAPYVDKAVNKAKDTIDSLQERFAKKEEVEVDPDLQDPQVKTDDTGTEDGTENASDSDPKETK
ncbi:YtxH domain-containing protein [Oenococcus alcoholitolerans]|uniref:YtxH domain-containing protein n=1 Tax=Oenococcus alcoholitolerans TaxID=931074 RepID=UPI003F721A7A